MRAAEHAGTAGSILVLVLWVIALLSLMTYGLYAYASLGARGERWQRLDAHGGLWLSYLGQEAMRRLAADEDEAVDSYKELWGRVFEMRPAVAWGPEAAQGEEVILRILPRDEYGKLNVNAAPLPALTEAVRQSPADAQAALIAEAIADWRDVDDFGGAESAYYEGLNPAYSPANDNFEHTAELRYVRGVDALCYLGEDANRNGVLDPEEDDAGAFWPPDNADGSLQPGLAELFTVFGDGAVNVNTARKEVLTAVLRASLLDPFRAEDVAAALIRRRRGGDAKEGTEDDAPFGSAAEIAAAAASVLNYDDPAQALAEVRDLGVASQAFRFYLRVEIPSQSYTRTASLVVVRQDGELQAQQWRED